MIQYDLKTGYPNLDLIPREQLSAIAAELFTQDRPTQYVGDMRGDTWTREQVGAMLTATTRHTVDVPDLQITAGAISSIDQVCRYITKPGDIVLVENPTFYFIIHKLELSHVTVMGVPMAEDGIDLDALDAICKEYGERVTMFYAIPSFHNPTGYTYTDAKRRGLVEMAHKHNFTIVEDSTYQLLYFGDTPPPPMLREYDTASGRVITVGSFSKMIMPSLRIGWIWATPPQVDELLPYKATATSVFMSQLVGRMIADGHLWGQLEHAQGLYGGKHNIMLNELAAHAPPGVRWTKPNGGYFIWMTLPDGQTATDALAKMHALGVDAAPGQRAFVNGEAPDNTLRLCFALLPDDAVAEGTRRLCEALS